MKRNLPRCTPVARARASARGVATWGGFCGDLRLRGRPPAPKAAPGARASRARQRGGARARWARASAQLIKGPIYFI